MSKNYWEIDPKNAEDHWVEFLDAEMKDPNSRWYHATVKWDGCIHFNRYHNRPWDPSEVNRHEDVDYLHICDLDAEIARLTELRDKAKAYFTEKRGEWPG